MRNLESSEESALSWSTTGVYLVAVGASLALLLSGCKTTPEKQTLTIEEAKQVAVELEDTALAAPPRSLAGLGKLPNDIDDIAEAPACVVPSEGLTQSTVETIARDLPASDRSGQLRNKAYEQERNGQLSNAIVLQRAALRHTPSDWLGNIGGNQLYLAHLLALAGEFSEAES